jgi:hypothetical protein
MDDDDDDPGTAQSSDSLHNRAVKTVLAKAATSLP